MSTLPLSSSSSPKKDHHLYIFFSAYLLTTAYQIWLSDPNALFYQLEHQRLYPLAVIYIGSLCLMYGAQSLQKSIKSQEIFCGSTLIFMFSYLYKANSLLMIIGFFILVCIGNFYAYWHKSHALILYNIILILSLIKGYYLSQTHHHHEKFMIDMNNSHLDRWLLVFLMILISLIISQWLFPKITVFYHQLPQKQITTGIKISIILLAGFCVFYTCQLMIAKSMTQSFSTFDKGIFTQMFENMSKGRGPITTLERDKVLSHFAVHISPIFYLMLPFYLLWPNAETLEVLQVIITFSGIIPFYLIVKHFNFTRIHTYILILLYVFAPALTAGHLYGLHENCFLAPLLLWLIYATIKEWRVLSMMLVILTLGVKEDAAIYVVSIGIYFIVQSRFFTGKNRKIRIFIEQITIPILYFVTCLFWLNQYGDGPMTSRFNNFMLENQTGLTNVIYNILLNPTYTLTSLFTQEKIVYLATLLSSLAFLPLMQAHLESYLLMIPMITINLLSDYPYQVNLGFQYHYGSSVLLLFMAIMALDDIRQYHASHSKWIPTLTIISLLVSVTFHQQYLDKAFYAYEKFESNPQMYTNRIETLQTIPKNKHILTFGNYTSHIKGAASMYDIFYHNDQQVDHNIDFVIASQSLMEEKNKERDIIKKYIQAGYTQSSLTTDQIYILEKPV